MGETLTLKCLRSFNCVKCFKKDGLGQWMPNCNALGREACYIKKCKYKHCLMITFGKKHYLARIFTYYLSLNFYQRYIPVLEAWWYYQLHQFMRAWSYFKNITSLICSPRNMYSRTQLRLSHHLTNQHLCTIIKQITKYRKL